MGDIFFIADPSQDPSRLRSLGQSQWEGHESVMSIKFADVAETRRWSVIEYERLGYHETNVAPTWLYPSFDLDEH